MLHYDKFDNRLSAAPFVPKLSVQEVEMSCYHCGRKTRVPVPRAYVDWETVAESYRKRLEDALKYFDQMGLDLDVMYGENPAAEYAANRLRMMVLEIRKRLDDQRRESGT